MDIIDGSGIFILSDIGKEVMAVNVIVIKGNKHLLKVMKDLHFI